jgi:hypothetical protein
MTLAWHFVGDTLRDGRPVPADGVTLKQEGPIVLCESGLHASVHMLDALGCAPGAMVCRVELTGTILDDGDKLVASARTILWRMDATDVLQAFARRCALDVIHLWDAPEVVRTYLETGDETLRAAAITAALITTYTRTAAAAYTTANAATPHAAATAHAADATYTTANAATPHAAATAHAADATAAHAAHTKYNTWLEEMVLSEMHDAK